MIVGQGRTYFSLPLFLRSSKTKDKVESFQAPGVMLVISHGTLDFPDDGCGLTHEYWVCIPRHSGFYQMRSPRPGAGWGGEPSPIITAPPEHLSFPGYEAAASLLLSPLDSCSIDASAVTGCPLSLRVGAAYKIKLPLFLTKSWPSSPKPAHAGNDNSFVCVSMDMNIWGVKGRWRSIPFIKSLNHPKP